MGTYDALSWMDPLEFLYLFIKEREHLFNLFVKYGLQLLTVRVLC